MIYYNYTHHEYEACIKFVKENEENSCINKVFQGKYLQSYIKEDNAGIWTQYIGLGKDELIINDLIEVIAFGVKEIVKYDFISFSINIDTFISDFGISAVEKIVQAIYLGLFQPYKELELDKYHIGLIGIKEDEMANVFIQKGINLGKSICLARELVNCPGNKLRPIDMANKIKGYLENTLVDVEILPVDKLEKMGMNGLLSIGNSSHNPPCLLVLKYSGDKNSNEKIGLIGKGVTCDTGGYCLKPSKSMAGIKGDMAGGAAVFAAIYSLAKNKINKNVIGIIPICENRISNSSLLPGDVIDTYSGKTIEVLNTDAEGRIILADALSYGIKNHGITKILDIATLTGAVVNMLGFSIGGVISDDDYFYEKFQTASDISGEQYLRLPFYKEHLNMIKSDVAHVKNIGENHSGTIIAGLFIREFAEGLPWIHVDIAGTAWVNKPIWKYQSKGGTGAGVSTLYYLCKEV